MCIRPLMANHVPKYVIRQRLTYANPFVFLSKLKSIEERRLISSRLLFMRIRCRYFRNSKKLLGRVINVATGVNNTLSILPQKLKNDMRVQNDISYTRWDLLMERILKFG